MSPDANRYLKLVGRFYKQCMHYAFVGIYLHCLTMAGIFILKDAYLQSITMMVMVSAAGIAHYVFNEMFQKSTKFNPVDGLLREERIRNELQESYENPKESRLTKEFFLPPGPVCENVPRITINPSHITWTEIQATETCSEPVQEEPGPKRQRIFSSDSVFDTLLPQTGLQAGHPRRLSGPMNHPTERQKGKSPIRRTSIREHPSNRRVSWSEPHHVDHIGMAFAN